MAKKTKDWIVMGGSPDEATHCTRCGDGMKVHYPIEIPIFLAMAKAFVKLHEKCQPKWVEPIPATLVDWLNSRDTGTSSKTLYAAHTGTFMEIYDVPYDPSDFGRCYRLIKSFPEVRDSVCKTTRLCPRWEPFVKNWDRFTTIYERDLPTGRSDELWDEMKKITDGLSPK